MTDVAQFERFDMGRVINRLFGVVGRNLAPFAVLAVLLVGLPTSAASFLQVIAGRGGNAETAATFSGAAIGLLFVTWIVGWVANAVLQGAIIHGAVTDLAGGRATFGECLASGFRFILPLVGIGLISGVCVVVGFFLLIVPGVLLSLAWSVAAPAAVMERTGVFGAYSRSLQLTRNHRGSIFGLAVLAVVVGFVIQLFVGGIIVGGGLATFGPQGDLSWGLAIVQAVSSLITQSVSALIGSSGVASVYYELRSIKEGVGAQQLASVFD